MGRSIGASLCFAYDGDMSLNEDGGSSSPASPALINFWNQLTPNMRGMVLMAGFAGLNAIMHTMVRFLSAEIHPMEIAFFRTIVPLIILIPMLIHQGRKTGAVWWRTARPGLQVIRGVMGATAMVTWFYSLSMIPVGDATALSFSVVIFASIGAIVFLGEKVGIRRWAAIGIGLLGTLIILQPGAQAINLGSGIALVSSLFWAGTLLVVKVLTRSDSGMTIVFYSSVFFTLFAAGPAFYYWTWPTGEQLALMITIGIMALVGHLAMAKALKEADATAIMPIDFTRLLWAAAVGYLWFGEFPELWTWVGGAVVFASTIYITYRESRAKPPVAAVSQGLSR
jgi:drug/metabolite transporter (DMT)-like permease